MRYFPEVGVLSFKPQENKHPSTITPSTWNPIDRTDTYLCKSYEGHDLYQYIGTVRKVEKKGEPVGYVVGRLYCTPGADFMCIAQTADTKNYIFRTPNRGMVEVTPDGKDARLGGSVVFRPDGPGKDTVSYELVKE